MSSFPTGRGGRNKPYAERSLSGGAPTSLYAPLGGWEQGQNAPGRGTSIMSLALSAACMERERIRTRQSPCQHSHEGSIWRGNSQPARPCAQGIHTSKKKAFS